MPDVLLRRQLRPEEITCPAGVLVGDASCRCNIEAHTLEAHQDPHGIEAYCAGDHLACPTWQAAKVAEANGRDLVKILDGMQDENRERRAREQIRQARLRRAQRLMVEDSVEGRQFRRRLQVGEYDPRVVAEAARKRA